jgi:hypothetical protein
MKVGKVQLPTNPLLELMKIWEALPTNNVNAVELTTPCEMPLLA